jgi:hypothetical protein
MIDRLVVPLLLVGCVTFGTILVFEIETPERLSVTPSAAVEHTDPPPALHQLPMAPAAPPIVEILARPLFSPSRRPPQSNPGNAADDSGLADSRLAGIIIEPGHRFAIFAPEGAKLLTVTEGETVSGWRVDNITSRDVSLSGPDGTRTLQPKFDPNLAPPAEAARPEPAAAAGPVFPGAPNFRAAPGVVVPRPGAPVFIPGQARLRQLRQR